jgi:hypothetical protein
MKASWLIGLMLALGVATSAQAGIEDAFGNTVVSHYADGGWVKHYFNPDGSYSAQFSDGRSIRGRWSVQGERVCLTHIRPSMLIPRFCSPLIQAEVGDTWHSRDPLGRRVRNVLVAGRD